MSFAMMRPKLIWQDMCLVMVLLISLQAYPISCKQLSERHLDRIIVKYTATSPRKNKVVTQKVDRARGETIDQALAKYQSLPDVEYAEPDVKIRAQYNPNDPRLRAQWGIFNARVDLAWQAVNFTRANTNTHPKVCIVDSGIAYRHPDLAPQMHPVHGRGFNAITGSYDADDDNGHGTLLAGIVGAAFNNGRGIAGIAPTASLIPCKFLNADLGGWVSDAITCIDYCHYTAGARLSSHSWGTFTYVRALFDKMKEVSQENHLFIAAAGNYRQDVDANGAMPLYPAAFKLPRGQLISVASLTKENRLESFSNYGARSVDLAAPGYRILSTFLDGKYAYAYGTSASTPFVTGTAALLAAVEPGMDARKIKKAILRNVRKVPSLQGKCVSGGTLDAEATLRAVKTNKGNGKVPL